MGELELLVCRVSLVCTLLIGPLCGLQYAPLSLECSVNWSESRTGSDQGSMPLPRLKRSLYILIFLLPYSSFLQGWLSRLDKAYTISCLILDPLISYCVANFCHTMYHIHPHLQDVRVNDTHYNEAVFAVSPRQWSMRRCVLKDWLPRPT